MAKATNAVRNSGVMTSALNAAQSTISSSLGVVGKVASSVAKTGGGVAATAVGDLGKLVTRMTSPTGGKPTPLESYVTMVTKHPANGMTSMKEVA